MSPITARPTGQLAVELIRQLRNAGHRAFLVGGCVRDLLLGIAPKDMDVATDATPDRLLELFPDAQKVGAHFGVMLVCRGESQVEIATFRSEHSTRTKSSPSAVTFRNRPGGGCHPPRFYD